MNEFLSRFFKDIGIDLGTANLLIYLKNRGLVVNEPSVVSVNTKTNKILAVGEEAKKMAGRTPNHINVIRPLINGVISDFDMTSEMVRHLLKRISSSMPFSSYRKAVIAIPNNLTEVERKSVEDAVISSGCTKVFFIESPLAAALGANLPISDPLASLIVDIGGGTSDIAVVSMNGVVSSKTLKIAGDKFNEDIIKFVRDEFNLIIGESTAEMAKVHIGSAVPVNDKNEIHIRGRDVRSGLPREVVLKNSHIRSAIAKSLRTITESIVEVIEITPPELVGDVVKQGIYLCGGGALFRGIDDVIKKQTGVNAYIVDDPLTCVARGLGRIVDDFNFHRDALNNPLKPMDINL